MIGSKTKLQWNTKYSNRGLCHAVFSKNCSFSGPMAVNQTNTTACANWSELLSKTFNLIAPTALDLIEFSFDSHVELLNRLSRYQKLEPGVWYMFKSFLTEPQSWRSPVLVRRPNGSKNYRDVSNGFNKAMRPCPPPEIARNGRQVYKKAQEYHFITPGRSAFAALIPPTPKSPMQAWKVQPGVPWKRPDPFA